MSSSSAKEDRFQNTEDIVSVAEKADLFAASAAEHALPSNSKASEAIPSVADDDQSGERTHGSSKQSSSSTSEPAVSLKEGVESRAELGHIDAEGKDSDAEALQQQPPQTKEELVEEALNCPCIASMKEGSCGTPFIAAYRCFLESETEPKGMDCMDQFKSMQACIAEHPDEYNLDDDDEDSDPFAHAQSDDVSSTRKPRNPSDSSPTKAKSSENLSPELSPT